MDASVTDHLAYSWDQATRDWIRSIYIYHGIWREAIKNFGDRYNYVGMQGPRPTYIDVKVVAYHSIN